MVTALIVDDELHNVNMLQTLLKENCPEVNVIDIANNADDAFLKINSLKPQLVFLDIRMPMKSGFDLLKMFNKIDFEVIFVSAFDEYAITAFEFNALGYILKPIDYSKLVKAVDKAVLKIVSKELNDSVFHFVKTLDDKNDLVNKIIIHHHDKVVLVNIRDIISVAGKSDSCELSLVDGSRFYSSKNLKSFEGILFEFKNFVRINKSAVINVNFISSYSKGEVCLIEMKNAASYEVSRRKKGEVLDKINSY